MKRAFTLIELLVVVAIMSSLGLAATGGYAALQRGMAERGATAAATALVKAAKERAMVDRSPTVVYCYNRLLRAADDENNAIVVGEAVAVRRAGRISYVQGKFLYDEFADIRSFGVVSDEEGESVLQKRSGMRLWRFENVSGSDMRYSEVADAVWKGEVSCDMLPYVHPVEGEKQGEMRQVTAYAFYNKGGSAHEPSAWKAGNGYGFEFARLQLPHNFVFDAPIPASVDAIGTAKPLYFDPATDSDQEVDVFWCRSGASGMPTKDHKAGTATSKENEAT